LIATPNQEHWVSDKCIHSLQAYLAANQAAFMPRILRSACCFDTDLQNVTWERENQKKVFFFYFLHD